MPDGVPNLPRLDVESENSSQEKSFEVIYLKNKNRE